MYEIKGFHEIYLMDILTHILSGTTTAACIALTAKLPRKTQLRMICLGALAGALPDIDALSLWSGFNSTIGTWLHLKHSGNQIYFGKFWY